MTDASTIAMTNCQEALLTLTNHINSGMDAMGDWEHKYGLVSQKLNRVMEENHKLRKQRDEVKMDNFKYEGFGGLKTQYKIMKEELDKLKTASNIETADRLEKLNKLNKQKKKKLEQYEKTITRLKNETHKLSKELSFKPKPPLDISEKMLEIHTLKCEVGSLIKEKCEKDMEINEKDIEIAGYKTMIENNAHELLELTNNEQRMRAIINKFVNQELYNKIIEEYYSENEHNITDNIETTGADIHNQALAHNQQLKDKKKNKTKPSQQLKLELTEPTSPKQIITGEGKTKCRIYDAKRDIIYKNHPDNFLKEIIKWGQEDKDTKNSIYANIRKKHKQLINKKEHIIEYTITNYSDIHCNMNYVYDYKYKLTIPITTP